MTTTEVLSTGVLMRDDIEALARFAKLLPHHKPVDDSTRILIFKMQTASPVPPAVKVRDKAGSLLCTYEEGQVTYPLIRKHAEDGRQLQFTYNCDGLGLIYTCMPIEDISSGISVIVRDATVYPSSGHVWRQPFNDELRFSITDLAIPGDMILYLEKYVTN